MKYLALILLTGCATTIDLTRAPPSDWPQLEIVVRRVTENTVRTVCKRPDLMAAYGCAAVSFRDGKCYIFLASDDADTLEHEKLHCRGYDHPGESSMRDGWAKYKAAR